MKKTTKLQAVEAKDEEKDWDITWDSPPQYHVVEKATKLKLEEEEEEEADEKENGSKDEDKDEDEDANKKEDWEITWDSPPEDSL